MRTRTHTHNKKERTSRLQRTYGCAANAEGTGEGRSRWKGASVSGRRAGAVKKVCDPGFRRGTRAQVERQRDKRKLSPTIERYIAAQVVAEINLTGPGDFLLGVEQHLFPLRNPARGARDGEQHREHCDREAHGLVNQAGVEVDIGIEATRDEIIVFEGDALTFK